MTKTKIFTITALMTILVIGTGSVLAADHNDGSIAQDQPRAIPSWVDNNFKWYGEGLIEQSDLLNSLTFLLDQGHMHLSDKAAKEMHELRSENTALKKKLDVDGIMGPKTNTAMDEHGRVKVQFHWDKETEQEALHHLRKAYDLNPNMHTMVVQFDDKHDKWIEILSIDWGASSQDKCASEAASDENSSCWIRVSQVHTSKSSGDMTLKGSKIHENAPSSDRTITYSGLEFASQKIKDLVSDGETRTTNWEDKLFGDIALKMHGTTDSTISELQGIVVLCSTAIEKEIQKIETELEILEELHDKKTDETTPRADPSAQYNESDLEFIKRHAERIDEKILSLHAGLEVLDQKLDSLSFAVEREMKESGEKAGTEDINIGVGELQEANQKQQQTLQTLSNISKSLRGTQTANLTVR